MGWARPLTLHPSPRDQKDSPVSALSQIPRLRCLELVAEVEAGVESVGVDRHALLTPPAPEGKEAHGVRTAQASPAPNSSEQSQPAYRAGALPLVPNSEEASQLDSRQELRHSCSVGLPTVLRPLPGFVCCRSPAPPSSLSLLLPLLLPLSLVDCLQDTQICLLQALPPLCTLCSPHALLPLTLLHTLPSFDSPGQSHLLQEGLPE